MEWAMTQADANISTHPEKSVAQPGLPAAPHNIAADPIGAVLILSGPPGETGSAPAILLRSDGSASALHAIPGADGVWSLSEPIEQLTPQKVRDCFLGMKAIRKEAAQEIERLIALLDRLDPDPDHEEQGDNDADLSEEEPSIGSVDNFTNQEKWSAGGITSEPDLEGEHDGREPDDEPEDGGDHEPSLGATNDADQSRWAVTGTNDRESDGGDEGEERRYALTATDAKLRERLRVDANKDKRMDDGSDGRLMHVSHGSNVRPLSEAAVQKWKLSGLVPVADFEEDRGAI
jgi:hypothetical protein